jgi:hypothetical protein
MKYYCVYQSHLPMMLIWTFFFQVHPVLMLIGLVVLNGEGQWYQLVTRQWNFISGMAFLLCHVYFMALLNFMPNFLFWLLLACPYNKPTFLMYGIYNHFTVLQLDWGFHEVLVQSDFLSLINKWMHLNGIILLQDRLLLVSSICLLAWNLFLLVI